MTGEEGAALKRLAGIRRGVVAVSASCHPYMPLHRSVAKLMDRIDEELGLLEVDIRRELRRD